jgi:uncharacterized protein YgiM (DUF1202 family)
MSLSSVGRVCPADPFLLAALLLAACAGHKPDVTPDPVATDSAPPAPPPVRTVLVTDTVMVKDPEQEQKIFRLELRLLEKEAQLDEVQGQLNEARQEVVRAMAKLQTLATRAEAASGIAEAEVAVQSLKTTAGQRSAPEYSQAQQLLRQSSAEFNKQNYGGALYLANQAKRLAGSGKGRLSAGAGGSLRPGEVVFAVPLRLRAEGRSNVRDGPGTGYKILFTMEAGTNVTAYSFVESWVRVSDDSGRDGWVARSLVGGEKNRQP